MMTTSSSESEDEEEKRKLELAVDPTFLLGGNSWIPTNQKNNGVSKTGGKTGSGNSEVLEEKTPASKRPKFEDSAELSEFGKPYSLEVTPDCQKFIAKQLAKSLDKSLKETCESRPPEPLRSETDTGIKLFATSQSRLTAGDLVEDGLLAGRKKTNKSKHKKGKSSKKRRLQDFSSDSEDEKLRSVAVTAEWVLTNNQ